MEKVRRRQRVLSIYCFHFGRLSECRHYDVVLYQPPSSDLELVPVESRQGDPTGLWVVICVADGSYKEGQNWR